MQENSVVKKSSFSVFCCQRGDRKETKNEKYKNIVPDTIPEYFIIIFFYISYLHTIKHKFDFNFIIFCMKKHSLSIT